MTNVTRIEWQDRWLRRSYAFLVPGVDRLGMEFMADVFEEGVVLRPDHLPVLAALAELYTQLGRVQEGLALDRRIVVLAPQDGTAHYNLACSLALLEQVDESFDRLERALQLGFDNFSLLSRDQDLALLREPGQRARFESLIARYVRSDGEEVDDAAEEAPAGGASLAVSPAAAAGDAPSEGAQAPPSSDLGTDPERDDDDFELFDDETEEF